MLVFLLIFEIVIAFSIVLSHIMIGEKYKEIEKSTQFYMDKRTYRTEKRIAFTDDVIKKYLRFIEQRDELPDLYSMLKSSLLRSSIGKFTFIGVNNVANKAKYIMWGVIMLEMAIGFMNNTVTSLEGIIVIISSMLLAIGMEIFIIVKALEEKKEAIIVLVEDYVLNAYPLQTNKQEKVANMKEDKVLEEGQAKQLILLTQSQRVNSSTVLVEDQKRERKERKSDNIEVKQTEGLTEKDIIRFINNLNNL